MLKAIIPAAAAFVVLLNLPSQAHATHLTTWHGGEGGTYFEAPCIGFMTGINARAGLYVDALQASCATNVGTWAGGSGGDSVSRVCPEGQAITGALITSGSWVDGVHFLCSTFDDIKNGRDRFSTTLGFIGGSGGGVNPITQCPTGQGAIGVYGWAGQFINKLGLMCREMFFE